MPKQAGSPADFSSCLRANAVLIPSHFSQSQEGLWNETSRRHLISVSPECNGLGVLHQAPLRLQYWPLGYLNRSTLPQWRSALRPRMP